MSRNLNIVLAVLLFHGGALWALQSGLMRHTAEMLIPAQVIMAMVESARVPALQQPQPRAMPALAKSAPALKHSTPLTPMAMATAPTQPSDVALDSVIPLAAATAIDRSRTLATGNTTASVISPTPARVELPSSDADYLNNPYPPYPPMSKRMGEQGKVVIRTLIGADGVAQEASIHQSSGFDRLDQAALATARKWRYVPGKRAGMAETMWFNVPFTFVLE